MGLDFDNDNLGELGSLTNEQIGRSLPELRKQIQWLAKRHGQGNDIFRYHQDALDQRLVVQRFGLNIDVVRETIFQACLILYEQITGMKAG